MKIIVVCENCGKEPPKSKTSNENWNVYDLKKKCPYCGGKLKLEIKD